MILKLLVQILFHSHKHLTDNLFVLADFLFYFPVHLFLLN